MRSPEFAAVAICEYPNLADMGLSSVELFEARAMNVVTSPICSKRSFICF